MTAIGVSRLDDELAQRSLVQEVGAHFAAVRDSCLQRSAAALACVLLASCSGDGGSEPQGSVETTLAIVVQPAGAVSGAPMTFQPKLEIRSSSGGRVPGSRISVTASVASGNAVITGNTLVSAQDGIATFSNLQLNGFGDVTIRFSATGLTGATSSALTVAQTSATLSVSIEPGGGKDGKEFTQQPVVEVRDLAGLAVRNATTPVTVAVQSGAGQLTGPLTVNSVNGIATFAGLRIDGVGAHSLKFTAPGLPLVTSSVFSVAQAEAALVLQTQPGGAVSGLALTQQPVVHVVDASGVPVAGNVASITAAISSGDGTLLGSATVNAVNGVATFTNLRIDGVGAHLISFSASGLSHILSGSVNVIQIPASLFIHLQPNGATTGSPLATQPVVRVLDHAGLTVLSASLPVAAARTTGSGTLSGTTTVNAVSGVATFADLRIDGLGLHRLTFSTSLPALEVTSVNISVATGPATQLAVVTQPGGATSGELLATQPVVRLVDVAGNTALSVSAGITATITSGTGTLAGTASVNAVAGIATFSDLRITGAGNHAIRFASGALAVTSQVFTVFPLGIAVLAGHAPTTAVTAGQDLTVPIVLDLSRRGPDNLASLSVTVSWDPARFTFKSITAGTWADGVTGAPANITVNSTHTGTGVLSIAGTVNDGSTISSLLQTVTLTANAAGVAVTSQIGVAVGAAGNTTGQAIAVTARPLSVTITPD